MNVSIKGVIPTGSSNQTQNNKAITSQEPKPSTPLTHAQVLAKRHVIKIDDRSNDPTQYFPFHVDCACGYHASVHTKEEAVAMESLHKHYNGVRE